MLLEIAITLMLALGLVRIPAKFPFFIASAATDGLTYMLYKDAAVKAASSSEEEETSIQSKS